MADDDTVRIFVEIPKGSRNKYELNQKTGEIELDRRLFAAVAYPVEYGFVKDTIGPDGEELDAMVVATEPTFPGCVIPVYPIAVLRLKTHDGVESNVLGVPVADPTWSKLKGVGDLPGDLTKEIEHFFESYSALEGNDWKVDGWGTGKEAWKAIAQGRDRFQAEHG